MLARAACERAAHRELRLAVVVAEVARARALARQPRVALQQRRLRRFQLQLVGEAHVTVAELCTVAAIALAQQRPILHAHTRVLRRCEGKQRLVVALRPAHDALRMQEPSRAQIAHRRMRQQQLTRGEAARVVAREAGARAEEGELEAAQLIAGLQLAGDVPPLDAVIVVCAEVAWKAQRRLPFGLRYRSPRRERGE